MPWQHFCHGMCENFSGLLIRTWIAASKTKFSLNLNNEQKFFMKWVPFNKRLTELIKIMTLTLIHLSITTPQICGWIYRMTPSNGNISILQALCEGNSPVTVNPLIKSGDAELWCFLWSAPEQNGWANHRDAGDHCIHCDITVMWNGPIRWHIEDLNNYMINNTPINWIFFIALYHIRCQQQHISYHGWR